MRTQYLSEWVDDRAFEKLSLVSGVEKTIRCAEIDGQVYEIRSGLVRVARLEDEWFEDIEDHKSALCCPADLLTFWQRPPRREIRHSCYHEFEHIAVMPITTYDQWLVGLDAKARNMVRKSARVGVTVRECEYDDAFVGGMAAIFNESSVRQGKKFWHYGKDVETVRRQFGRYVHRETMLRADFEGEMVGFVMLGWAGEYALIGQILSSLKHRDRAVNNALMAKIVEVCAARGVSQLCYYYWDDESSLTWFKRSMGFEKVSVPRYYVPLTWRGSLALKLGIHRGLRALIPPKLKTKLKGIRALARA
jgi:hypothetical protein